MVEDKYFLYYTNILEVDATDSRPVYVDNIKSKADILNLFYQSLKFPDYFGFNWEALSDCLTRIEEWNLDKSIIIINCENIHLKEHEFSIYISVLYDACELWERYPDVLEFRVFFPQRCRDKIQEILKTISSRFP